MVLIGLYIEIINDPFCFRLFPFIRDLKRMQAVFYGLFTDCVG